MKGRLEELIMINPLVDFGRAPHVLWVYKQNLVQVQMKNFPMGKQCMFKLTVYEGF